MVTENRKARRISVISGKGGVGKSVITANLAAALSSVGRKILVVDADLGLANLDVILDITTQFTIHDVLHRGCDLSDVLVATTKGFDLIPAGSGLTEGTMFTKSLAGNLEALLCTIEDRYDAILFDAGAGIGDVVLFFANLADEILLVATPEPTSLMDAYASIKILHQLYGRREFLLIVNQTNPECSDQVGASIAGHLQNVISRYLESDGAGPIQLELIGSIPMDPIVPQSIRQRMLLAETGKKARATCQVNDVADLINLRIARAQAC